MRWANENVKWSVRGHAALKVGFCSLKYMKLFIFNIKSWMLVSEWLENELNITHGWFIIGSHSLFFFSDDNCTLTEQKKYWHEVLPSPSVLNRTGCCQLFLTWAAAWWLCWAASLPTTCGKPASTPPSLSGRPSPLLVRNSNIPKCDTTRFLMWSIPVHPPFSTSCLWISPPHIISMLLRVFQLVAHSKGKAMCEIVPHQNNPRNVWRENRSLSVCFPS